MRTSLRWQILGLYLGLLVLGVGGLAAWSGYQLKRSAEERAYHELVAKALIVAAVVQEPLEHHRLPQAVVAGYARSTGARVVVLDRRLRVLASSEPAVSSHPTVPRQGWGVEGSGRRLYATVPVADEDGRARGAVELSVPEAAVLAPVRTAWAALAAAGVVVVGTVAVATSLLAAWITRPLRLLTDAADAVAAGRLSQRVRVEGAEEVRRLGSSFNRMAEQVEAMVAQQRAFAARAAHELRSPLASVRLRLEVLRDKVARDPVALEFVDDTLRVLDRLRRLTDHLLVLAAVQETGAPQRRPVDLAPVLYELVEEVSALAADAGLRLEVDVPPHLPEVLADPEQIGLAVRNLLDNAIKYTAAGGRVTVRASASDRSVELVVADTGVGIAPEHLPKVFDRFYRVPAAGRGPEGSGLGLALVREVVEAHGGRVDVRSTPGAGTEFRVRLPREASAVP
ncbi:MAG: HAMP domain-containing sensor histidine kinase [Armatimonadota bacterium]|nr:HAMP domain-containing sensor histidine kinase [Armatimonadota bacterium]MDR7396050.1 HAMP domain-containing sensor histidine kinase [Armatimonadota bacterium]MDR7399535.1 HAMP domain-containing sensor histidine kinase [Armatimonadota bacterium]MDR7407156.1 HAMP domain-containing sensor histidine kinase [Armatimonadota bacterium]MDR7408090.1 HAMP domain-containing sensor histidine kinase [Armatimonadota bacterium]